MKTVNFGPHYYYYFFLHCTVIIKLMCCGKTDNHTDGDMKAKFVCFVSCLEITFLWSEVRGDVTFCHLVPYLQFGRPTSRMLADLLSCSCSLSDPLLLLQMWQQHQLKSGLIPNLKRLDMANALVGQISFSACVACVLLIIQSVWTPAEDLSFWII